LRFLTFSTSLTQHAKHSLGVRLWSASLFIALSFLYSHPVLAEKALKKGDKVITNGGFIVVIQKVEENFLTIKMNDDMTAKITKDSIAKKYEDEA